MTLTRLLGILLVIFAVATLARLTGLSDSFASERYGGTVVRGTSAFRERMLAALELLGRNSPTGYALVAGQVRLILESPPSDRQRVGVDGPRRVIDRELDADVDELDDEQLRWLAATLVHDARHIQLYAQQFKQPDESVAWNQASGEALCLALQAEVLEWLGGAPEALRSVRERDPARIDPSGGTLHGNPTYVVHEW